MQLMRVVPAFDAFECTFVSTNADNGEELGGAEFHVVREASQSRPLECLRLGCQMLRIVLRQRPAVVFSTGAAPGCFAILAGRLIGARTIWLDSIANTEKLSLSGRLIQRVAGLCLTQWPGLVRSGVEYAGDVL